MADPTHQSLVLADPVSGWFSGGLGGDLASLVDSLGTGGPLQIELNGNFSHSGLWVPVAAEPKCQANYYDTLWPNRSTCYVTRQGEWKKQRGWDEVVVRIGTNPFVMANLVHNITGVRYAWGTNPCCPGLNRNNIGCPPASCPIQGFNSSFPAVPFWATIADGKCDFLSTQGPPAKGFKEHGLRH